MTKHVVQSLLMLSLSVGKNLEPETEEQYMCNHSFYILTPSPSKDISNKH